MCHIIIRVSSIWQISDEKEGMTFTEKDLNNFKPSLIPEGYEEIRNNYLDLFKLVSGQSDFVTLHHQRFIVLPAPVLQCDSLSLVHKSQIMFVPVLSAR